MSQAITISAQDILQQVKLSCQIPSLVEQIVTRKVVMDAAAEAGIKVEDEELQQAADQIRLISKLKTADETWEWLKKNCLSLDDFEEMVYTNVMSGKLAQHLFGDKIEPWFVEHQLDYAGAVIYEVVLDDEDLAVELFYALQEGEISFFEIAQQYIQDTELRRRGGYRGIVRRNEMKPEISAAVFAAKSQQVLKPIVGAKGVHLILVEEVIKPQLNEKLRYQILSDLFPGWIKQKIEEVDVVTDLELSRLTC
jgi:parvulin-like peptidyl-prolyl isomerase